MTQTESAVLVTGDEQLRFVTKERVAVVKRAVSVDWTLKGSRAGQLAPAGASDPVEVLCAEWAYSEAAAVGQRKARDIA